MFPSSWLNNVASSSTSGNSVREPDERCVATGPLQLTANQATAITKATANVLWLSILDFIPIPPTSDAFCAFAILYKSSNDV